MTHRTIGIDCRLGGIANAGIGRYVSELVQRVTKSTREFSWVLFCTDGAQAAELLQGKKPGRSVKIVYAPVRQYSFAEQMILPDIFNSVQIDLLHVPHFNVPIFYNKPTVVTIHDLLWHEYRGQNVTTLNPLMYWPKYWTYKFVTRHAVTTALNIFVPTNTVKDTVKKYYPQVSKKVQVTYEGIGTELISYAPKVKNLPRQKNQLLYVGSLYPHKNVSLVLEALEKMPDYSLEIVGSRNVFQEKMIAEVEDRGLSDRVIFAGRLTDEQLAEHYAQATALVQPSLSEGFGLTGLEALAFETPVIASDTHIFHEVYKDAAIYFSKNSAESFRDAVKEVEKEKVRSQLKKNAVIVQNSYSWDRLATETLAGYEEVLTKL